jgi:hypothetical protein
MIRIGAYVLPKFGGTAEGGNHRVDFSVLHAASYVFADA